MTLESQSTIASARNLYDVLPDSAKALVTNYDVLVNDEAVYAILAAGGTAEQQPAEEQQPTQEQAAEE